MEQSVGDQFQAVWRRIVFRSAGLVHDIPRGGCEPQAARRKCPWGKYTGIARIPNDHPTPISDEKTFLNIS
jgi:hypothetical protein